MSRVCHHLLSRCQQRCLNPDAPQWLSISVGGDEMKSLELFTGAGGMALGLERAGFNHEVVVEWDSDSCATLRRNTRWSVLQVDVRSLDFTAYQGRIDLIASGVPCQPFSVAGRRRGDSDARDMFPAFLSAVRAVWPKSILIENVSGLAGPMCHPYFEYIKLQLGHPTFEGISMRHGSDTKAG